MLKYEMVYTNTMNAIIKSDLHHMHEDKEENDLIVPFRGKSKFLRFLLRNKELSKVAFTQTIICYSIAATIFIALSIYMFVIMSRVVNLKHQYLNSKQPECGAGATCNYTFTIDSYMEQPVYILYELDNFFQNHRRYVQSKSNSQLAGNTITFDDASLCKPFITNEQLKVNKSWGNVTLDPQAVASPCGAIAYTIFNDTFQLFKQNNAISINENGISWPGDQTKKYRRSENSSQTQWVDPENEHFIVWMRTAGLPNFQKLWGRIQTDLTAGNYTMMVTNNYRLTEWNGDKYFVLTTASPLGGKNYILPAAFLVIGVSCLLGILLFTKKALEYKKIVEK